jgi:hypothetical protein
MYIRTYGQSIQGKIIITINENMFMYKLICIHLYVLE